MTDKEQEMQTADWMLRNISIHHTITWRGQEDEARIDKIVDRAWAIEAALASPETAKREYLRVCLAFGFSPAGALSVWEGENRRFIEDAIESMRRI